MKQEPRGENIDRYIRVAVNLTPLARTALVCSLALAISLSTGQNAAVSDAAKPIIAGLRGLRSLSDADRVGATKNLALQIRKLPAGKEKLGLANSLANLSTEGDFGRDTL